MLNQTTIKGKWNEIKGEIRKTWGELTDNELDKVKGDLTSIEGLLQQRYGMSKSDAKKKLTSIVDRFEDSMDDIKDEVRGNGDLRQGHERKYSKENY